MSRFAKLSEQELKRRKELKKKEEKNYQFETFFLYMLIKFHTWDDSGICKQPITKIIEIWNLDYNNSMRRYKFLREKKWIEAIPRKDGDWIRPLIGLKTVNSTVETDDKTVNSTVEKGTKTVNSTVKNCKLYSKKGSKTVNSTVAYKEYIEPLKNPELSSEPTTSETDVVSSSTDHETNGHKSQFSLAEILQYLDARISAGEKIETPHKLAQWMYQTGEFDAFISATLYPQPKSETHIEYDDEYAPEAVEPLDEAGLEEARLILGYMVEHGRDLSEFRKGYAPSDWQKLTEELGK